MTGTDRSRLRLCLLIAAEWSSHGYSCVAKNSEEDFLRDSLSKKGNFSCCPLGVIRLSLKVFPVKYIHGGFPLSLERDSSVSDSRLMQAWIARDCSVSDSRVMQAWIARDENRVRVWIQKSFWSKETCLRNSNSDTHHHPAESFQTFSLLKDNTNLRVSVLQIWTVIKDFKVAMTVQGKMKERRGGSKAHRLSQFQFTKASAEESRWLHPWPKPEGITSDNQNTKDSITKIISIIFRFVPA